MRLCPPTRGPRVINDKSKKAMKAILKEIQDGKFTREWVKEYKAGYPKFNELRKQGEQHGVEKVGKKLRALMPWVPKKDIKGAQASYSSN